MDVKYIVVHCSATRPSQDIDVKTIDAWHKERGFDKIGYHYVIKRNGNVETGRDEQTQGAHALGYNHNSLGVCLVGGANQDDHTKAENKFTNDQWNSVDNQIEQIEAKYTGVRMIVQHDRRKQESNAINLQERKR